MRYLINYLLITFLSFSQISCSHTPTTALDTKEGRETLSSFLVSPDRATLVVIGQEHHFIMQMQQPLRSIMQWESLYKLNPSFGAFSVDLNQAVTGSYTLEAKLNELQPNERDFLRQHGFRLKPHSTILSFSSHIQGTRYLAGKVQIPQAARFKKPYSVTTYSAEKTLKSGLSSDITQSPLALAVDGVSFILFSVALIPAVILFPESFN